MPSSFNHYIEYKVDGQKCYIAEQDLIILSGLSANRSSANPMQFGELSEDARIVKIYVVRKWNTGRRKALPVVSISKGK